MNKITRDFVAEDNREYKFKIGSLIASSLTGFIAGFIVASIIFVVIFTVIKISAL